MIPWWVQSRAEQLVLELRELLVRCDENLKAHTLLEQCVPYFLENADHPQIRLARDVQRAMVEHITGGSEAYARYYETNAHERPFEEQYGIQASAAHKHLPRVAFLRESLGELRRLMKPNDDHPLPVLLDLSCNDGWMAANLRGMVEYHGIDLNPACVARAEGRKVPRAWFTAGNIADALELTALRRPVGGYDVVVCFECLEHVPDPVAIMSTIAGVVRAGGRIFLSTPNGAVEDGDLPRWWTAEPKGHVRVFTPDSFHALISPWGEVDAIAEGPDGVLIAAMTSPDSRVQDAGEPVQPDRTDRAGAAGAAD